MAVSFGKGKARTPLTSCNMIMAAERPFRRMRRKGQRFDPAYLHQKKQSSERVAVFFSAKEGWYTADLKTQSVF